MKQLLVIAILLGAILVPAYWFYSHYILADEPAVGITADSVIGEVLSGTDAEHMQILQRGSSLSGGSVVSTGEKGWVLLSMPEGGEVELGSNSELAVKQIYDDSVSFELRNGKIKATVKHFHKRNVKVEFTGNPAAVEIRDGIANVVTDGTGAFDVGVEIGDDISLVRGDEASERIPAGEHRAVQRDGVIAQSGEIPRSVLLKVNWPEQSVYREKEVELRGSVTPGSSVRIDGRIVGTENDGSFTVSVPLEEGANRIEVEASGLGGTSVQESPELILDTRPPKVETATDGIWKSGRF